MAPIHTVRNNGLEDGSLPDSLQANEMLKSKKLSRQGFEDLMKSKRNNRDRDERYSRLFFFVGLNISLLVMIITINWKSYDQPEIVSLGDLEADFSELTEVPISEQPPPPPPPKVVSEQIVEVSNEEIIEEIDIELDVEMTEETVMEEILPEMEIEEEETEEIFTIVENWPEPIGGMAAFYEYVGKNIVYPTQAKRLGITGRVFVNFVVERNGSISEAKVVKGIGAGCDEEAIRVVSSAPAWKPGKQRGRPVRVFMTVPIYFKLQVN